MIKVSVLYPNQEGGTFNMAYHGVLLQGARLTRQNSRRRLSGKRRAQTSVQGTGGFSDGSCNKISGPLGPVTTLSHEEAS